MTNPVRTRENEIHDWVRSRSSVHFCGIGGVGMAGIARLLLQDGIRVSGSEMVLSPLTVMLRDSGAMVHQGHHPSRIPQDVQWAVRTPAVHPDNPEVLALRERGIPVYDRAELLAAIANARTGVAVAGAHGKTTTSAMLAHLMRTCGKECGYAVGGITGLEGLVADRGSLDPFVFEADESDGSLVHYRPALGVVTNIEWDHVDRFETERELFDVFETFITASDRIVINADDRNSRACSEGHPQIVTAGFSEGADLRVEVCSEDESGQQLRFTTGADTAEAELRLPGRHNANNAALAVQGGVELGLTLREAVGALSSFRTVGRRFDRIENGGRIAIGDYAHHPTEIRALLDSVRPLNSKRIVAVFQPHRFSRTKHWMSEFAAVLSEIDETHLVPVYAASEAPVAGGSSRDLAETMGLPGDQCHSSLEEAWETLRERWQPGTLLLVIGAGDVEQLFDRARVQLNEESR